MRFTRTSLLVGLLVAAVLPAQMLSPSGALALGPGERQVTQIPVKWCAMKGAPTVEQPFSLGNHDTSGILLRRLWRANETIWSSKIDIEFRSAITREVLEGATVPLIDDPRPPGNGPGQGPGRYGDVLDPDDLSDHEALLAKQACQAAWKALKRSLSLKSPLPGIIAVSVDNFVNKEGHATDTYGWTCCTSTNPGSYCTHGGKFTSTSGGFMILVDRSNAGSDESMLVAHELGHALKLGHGNGIDDGTDGLIDSWCDSESDDTPETLMDHFLPDARPKLTDEQKSLARRVARAYSGSQIDPGPLESGDTFSDVAVDAAEDVATISIDLTDLDVAVNRETGSLTLTQSLLGTVPNEDKNEYFTFLDLDGLVDDAGNGTTGGSPSDIGISSPFNGVDLITYVIVGSDREVQRSVLRWQDGVFADVTDDTVTATIEPTFAVGETVPINDVVTVEVPKTFLEGMAVASGGDSTPAPLRVQAAARASSGEVDYLPAGIGEEPTNDSDQIYLEQPRFPFCGPTYLDGSDRVDPGNPVEVTAGGFLNLGAPVDIVLGDETLLAEGVPINADGFVDLVVDIPADAVQGLRLLTFNVQGTALTADCIVQVGEIPPDGG